MTYYWPFRKPVQELVESVHVVCSTELRASVSYSLRVSEKSTITQEIVMDAMCPYIRFNTRVQHL